MRIATPTLELFRLPTGELDFSRVSHYTPTWGSSLEVASLTFTLATTLLLLWIQIG